MSALRPPGLDPRRFGDFESELRERARTWVPSWGLTDGERDFGQALLEVAARFNAEVAERLDRVGIKMARGFLDWLALRGDAARPARLPVVFKLADTAQGPVDAPHPVRMQVDVPGATVPFETETDLRLVPGHVELVVGADPSNDAYFLPPPGLSSLDPVEPLPTRWQLKSFAAPEATVLQLDPGVGLTEGMLIEIAGQQYRISNPKDDLATIEPPVPAGEGFAPGTPVTKVEAFYPFDGARDQQNHILYIGHTDLLNIEAQAAIEVTGVQTLGPGVTWEYWGKEEGAPATDADPKWRELLLAKGDPQHPELLVLSKPKGAVEPRKIGAADSRWIRARKAHLTDSLPAVTTDEVTLRINPKSNQPSVTQKPDPATLPAVDAVVNTTPSPTKDFYPLGREPRMFDALYLGCSEAFSKKNAEVEVMFDLAEPSFISMAAINSSSLGGILAGVDKAGALHLFSINANGTLSRLPGRDPMRPKGDDPAAPGIRLSSSKFQPVLWSEGTTLFAAVTAGNDVWAWKETRPDPTGSDWKPFGSLPADPDPVAGLVPISLPTGARGLVALRGGKLWKRKTGSDEGWTDLTTTLPEGEVIELIAPIKSEVPGVLSRSLLAITSDANGKTRLRRIRSNGSTRQLLANVAKDVAPFGILRSSGDREVVAVTQDSALWALRSGTAPKSTKQPLEAGLAIANTALDGRIEGSQLTAYCLASSAGGPPTLLAWKPFDSGLEKVIFQTQSDPDIGTPTGSVTLYDQRAYLPGINTGEVLAASLDGARSQWTAKKLDFKSALAVTPSAPVIKAGDTIGVEVSGSLQPVGVTTAAPVTGRGAYSNLNFILLDSWLNRSTASETLQLYETSAQGPSFKANVDAQDPQKLTLTQGQLPQDEDWLLIKDTANNSVLAKVVGVQNPDIEIDQEIAPGVTAVLGWIAKVVPQGRIFPALQLDTSNNGWPLEDLDRGHIYFPELNPIRQQAIAVAADSQTPPRPQWLAFGASWIAGPTAAQATFIVDGAITGWAQLLGDSSSNPALAWEYWNGTGWWRLDLDKDHTGNLKNSGLVEFKVPGDLKPVDWAGKTSHWIRARLIGGDYGRERVFVITERAGPGKTKQTIERSTEGIQPPFALDVWVRYGITEPVLPIFLQTLDSGTLRDQSDANRTPDAQIEILTPLIYALGTLEVPATASGSDRECVPDCACPSGTASESFVVKVDASATISTPSTPTSRVARRALYIGLGSKPSGEPVNLLFVVDMEKPYDRLAPLNVDAIIGDRFVPIVARDSTRAIGETGLISMSFSVEPSARELFGRSLTWLRLTPGDAALEWKPMLRGVHLNAVWARSAETMTRELVGSSEGAPNLTLRLARPPLLKDSLELRVKEPLSQEERDQLAQDDPDKVKSKETDLPGHWVLWTQVDDPRDHEATARVYSLDEDQGVIRFGDGRHGAIPPIGADVVVAFKYERTEPATVDGVPANLVTARSVLNLITPVESVEAAVAADQAAGGIAPESPERVQRFAAARLRHRGRAVTVRDFEDLTLQKFTDVVQTRCFARGGRIRLVVVMRGENPMPSQAQRREMKQVLLSVAPAALAGSERLHVEGPAVRRLRIRLKLRVATLDSAGEVASSVKKTLQSFFNTDTSNEDRNGWMLGASPREADIAEALLDVQKLESIVSIGLAEVDADGSERSWRQNIKADELAMLADDGIRIEFEIVETAG